MRVAGLACSLAAPLCQHGGTIGGSFAPVGRAMVGRMEGRAARLSKIGQNIWTFLDRRADTENTIVIMAGSLSLLGAVREVLPKTPFRRRSGSG